MLFSGDGSHRDIAPVTRSKDVSAVSVDTPLKRTSVQIVVKVHILIKENFRILLRR